MLAALDAETTKDFDTYLTWSQSGKVANQYWHIHEHLHKSGSGFTKWMQLQGLVQTQDKLHVASIQAESLFSTDNWWF